MARAKKKPTTLKGRIGAAMVSVGSTSPRNIFIFVVVAAAAFYVVQYVL